MYPLFGMIWILILPVYTAVLPLPKGINLDLWIPLNYVGFMMVFIVYGFFSYALSPGAPFPVDWRLAVKEPKQAPSLSKTNIH
jgi:hypothetical protein